MKRVFVMAGIALLAGPVFGQKTFKAEPNWTVGTELRATVTTTSLKKEDEGAEPKVEDFSINVRERDGDHFRLVLMRPNRVFDLGKEKGVDLSKQDTGLELVEHVYAVHSQTGHPTFINSPEVLTLMIDSWDRVMQGLEVWGAEALEDWERLREPFIHEFEVPPTYIGVEYLLTGTYGKELTRKDTLEENIKVMRKEFGMGAQPLNAVQKTWLVKHKSKTTVAIHRKIEFNMDDFVNYHIEQAVKREFPRGAKAEEIEKRKAELKEQTAAVAPIISQNDQFLFNIETNWVQEAKSTVRFTYKKGDSVETDGQTTVLKVFPK